MAGRKPMTPVLALVLACSAVLIGGCGSPQGTSGLPKNTPDDAPYELTKDDDLDLERERFDTLRAGPERLKLRRKLAAEYASRVTRDLDAGKRDRAYAAFQRLAGLWSGKEIAAGQTQDLAKYIAIAKRVTKVFAKSGSDHQASGALYVLREIDQGQRAQYDDELAKIFEYADDVAVTKYGQGAERSRTIEILEGVSRFWLAPRVVNRLVILYKERQAAVDSRIRRTGADFNLVRAHGAGVLRSTWNIVSVLARANRLGEAKKTIYTISGIGDDTDLRARLTTATSPQGTPDDWVELAQSFRFQDDEKSDYEAELAVARAGLRRFPKSPALHLVAGNSALDQERVRIAISHYEKAAAAGAVTRNSAEKLARLYEARVVTLALNARVKEATAVLDSFVRFHRKSEKKWAEALTPDPAQAYAAMGQGLLSIGQLDESQAYLKRSLKRRPTMAALEFLGTIASKRGQFGEARSYYEQALRLNALSGADRFRRNKILRLAGEAAMGSKQTTQARRHLAEALGAWEAMAVEFELSGELLADLLVETGKLQWLNGHQDAALVAFEAAIDAVPDNESVHAEVIAYLIVHDRFDTAIDAYHRALGSPAIGDAIKVYMSLWMISEANFKGRKADALAVKFIAQRRGQSWQSLLAQHLLGQRPDIARQANTHRKRTELNFYQAVILHSKKSPARARKLLQRALESALVLDYEYDMARLWLRRLAK